MTFKQDVKYPNVYPIPKNPQNPTNKNSKVSFPSHAKKIQLPSY